MKLADKVQDWLNKLEWEDKIVLDEENQTSSLNFTYSIKDQSFKAWVETDEERDVFKVYFYAPFNALSTKHTECAVLFNYINAISDWGSISLLDTKGTIRWRYVIDFEDTTPSVSAINNAFMVGANLLGTWFDEITEVALTKASAQEIIDRITTDDELLTDN